MTRRGCATWFVVAVLAVVGIVVAIGETFDEGDTPGGAASGFDAGPVDAFPSGDVQDYTAQEHLYVVRLPDGEFLAIYDKPTKQQEQGGDCRVTFQEKAAIGALAPIPGLSGAFVADCEDARAVWRPDGAFAFGSSYGDLDRFDTHIDEAGH